MNIIYYLQFYINTIISYCVFGGYTFYLDYKNKNFNNKIQHKDKEKILNIYKKVLPLVFFNIFVTTFFFSLFYIYLIEYYNLKYFPENYTIGIFKLFFMRYFVDIPFYLCHRLFHYPYLYKYHKVHHEIKAPIGISAAYSHPIDYIFGNLIPIFIPFLFLKVDYVFLHIWAIFTIFTTIYESHGGFKNLSEFHDIHHKYFKYNFGTDFIMDSIFKTKRIE